MRCLFCFSVLFLVFFIACENDDPMDGPTPQMETDVLTPNSDDDGSDSEDGEDNSNANGSDSEDDSSNIEFEHTKIPMDIKELYESRGDLANDTVWVFVQGGPSTDRDYVFHEERDDGSPNFPDFVDDLVVYPFQAQHFNSSRFENVDLTFEQAKIESATTTEIIKRVVEDFVKKEKIVYLIGHSFGSFVVNDFLSKHGNLAHKSASLNGRLNMDDVVWKGFLRGELWLFDLEGKNPYRVQDDVVDGELTREDLNMAKLASGLGHKRYTNELESVDLSEVIFVTAKKDWAVGFFSAEEIEFLEETNIPEKLIILEVEEDEEGHIKIFKENSIKELHDLIISKDALNSDDS